MGLNLDKLVFDVTDVDEGQNVGAYLRSSDGTLIDHVTIATVDRLAVDSTLKAGDGTDITQTAGALDVNIASGSVTVTATDLDIRDLSATQDNVAISDGTDTLAINGDGSINSTVTATDLDIRDLVNTQDSIAIGDETTIVDMATMDSAFGVTSAGFPIMGIRQDAAGSPVSATGDAHPLVFNADGELKVAADLSSSIADDAADSGNPIKVGSRAVDGLLTAVSATNDRADLLSDLYRRVWVNDSANVGWQATQEDVGTTAGEIAATPLPGRKKILIQNTGNKAIAIGQTAGVTFATGTIIHGKSSMELPMGEDLNVFAIAKSGTQDIRITELA